MYEIEIAGPKNEQQFFSPTQSIVRGRWHVANVSTREQSTAMRDMNRVNEIPGKRISLGIKKRIGKITDPLLTSKEGVEKFKEINKISTEHQESLGGEKKLEEDQEFKNLTLDEIKTWLHHMRAIIDNKMGQKTENSLQLPSLEKISTMPGKRIKDPGNTGSKDKDLKDQQFVDSVPANEK